jgi:Uma2 family endonuclease
MGNLRSPDVSFIAAGRLPEGVPTGFLHVPPDLAVEVLSHADRAGDVAHKVGEYLGVGVRLLWVVDPDQEGAVVYRPGRTPPSIRKDGALDGEDVLPGFSCPLQELLDRKKQPPRLSLPGSSVAAVAKAHQDQPQRMKSS